jgi:hypothetical protein
MTATTPNGIRTGHRVTITHPALPNERGELVVTEVIWPIRLVLRNAAGEMICRDVNYWDVKRVILPLPLTAQAGRHIVHAHKVRDGVYRVEVREGGLAGFGGVVDEGLTESFDSEKTAREYAEQTTRDLRELADAKTIEAVTA